MKTVNFSRGTRRAYDSLVEKSQDTIYFITDTNEIFMGDEPMSKVNILSDEENAETVYSHCSGNSGTEIDTESLCKISTDQYGHVISFSPISKSDIISILGGAEETWTFTDDSGQNYEKKIIVLN